MNRKNLYRNPVSFFGSVCYRFKNQNYTIYLLLDKIALMARRSCEFRFLLNKVFMYLFGISSFLICLLF